MELFNCKTWLQGMDGNVRRGVNINMTDETFAVLCLNVTCDSNLGNMIRTACLMGCKRFYMAGRRKWDRRASVGSNHYLDIIHLPDIYNITIDTHHSIECDCGECKRIDVQALTAFLQGTGMTPVFVEQGGKSVLDRVWHVGTGKHLFIYGNESHGIPAHIILQVQRAIPDTHIVSVPQLGVMRSHNVATVCTIVLWEYCRKTLERLDLP